MAIDEKQLLVYEIVIDALRKQSNMKEVIDQLPEELQLNAIKFLEFVDDSDATTPASALDEKKPLKTP